MVFRLLTLNEADIVSGGLSFQGLSDWNFRGVSLSHMSADEQVAAVNLSIIEFAQAHPIARETDPSFPQIDPEIYASLNEIDRQEILNDVSNWMGSLLATYDNQFRDDSNSSYHDAADNYAQFSAYDAASYYDALEMQHTQKQLSDSFSKVIDLIEAFIAAGGESLSAESTSALEKIGLNIPNINQIQKDTAIREQNFCNTDPYYRALISSSNFSAIESALIQQSKSTADRAGNLGVEFASIYFENWGDGGTFSKPFTSYLSDRVWINDSDMFSFIRGWGDVIVHTHFDARAGLSGSDRSMALKWGVRMMAIDFTAPGGTTYYCYIPEKQ